MKRIFDFVAALGGMIIGWPLLVGLAAVIKFHDHGSALFRQQRVGLGGRHFILLKFRSMSVSKEAEKGSFEAGRSSRVTRVGRFLRKTKLDELPQLWNVLKGDMSLVGPRPEVRKWVETYPERWAIVHTVRPGITDPASIEFRNEEDLLSRSPNPERTYREEILPRKLALYEEYVRTRSFCGDIKLIFATFVALFK